MSSDPVVQRRSAEEAFALLGNPLRVDILRALAETPTEPVGFADLRRRVGERDSGKFNYHLAELLGSFVRKVEADDGSPAGYELTVAGRQVVGAILAGTYTADVALSPIPVGTDCASCGAELEARYEDEHAVVRCPDCGEFENRHSFPPGTVGQFDRAELPAAFDRWLRTSFGRTVAGFCTTCGGRVDAELRPDDEWATDHDVEAYARFTCPRCGNESRSSVYLPLLYHPAAVAFFYDHGVDVTTTPSWALVADADGWTTERISGDPLRVRVTVPLDDEVLVATVDETVTVTDVERRPR